MLLAIVVTWAAVLYGKPVVLIVVLCFALCDCVIPRLVRRSCPISEPDPLLWWLWSSCARGREVPGPPGFPFMKLL